MRCIDFECSHRIKISDTNTNNYSKLYVWCGLAGDYVKNIRFCAKECQRCGDTGVEEDYCSTCDNDGWVKKGTGINLDRRILNTANGVLVEYIKDEINEDLCPTCEGQGSIGYCYCEKGQVLKLRHDNIEKELKNNS